MRAAGGGGVDEGNGDISGGGGSSGSGSHGLSIGGSGGVGASGGGAAAAAAATAAAAAASAASPSVGGMSAKDCNKRLREYSSRGEGDKAVALISRMWAEGVTPSSRSYSSAINACGDSGRWEQALALLREACSRRVGGSSTPNAFHYVAAIKACGASNQGDQVSEREHQQNCGGVGKPRGNLFVRECPLLSVLRSVVVGCWWLVVGCW